MVWTLPEPMLAEPVNNPALPSGWAAEPKWDGYRALLARYADGRVVIRSRRGTDMTAAFPEITRAAASLPAGVEFAMDGELWLEWSAVGMEGLVLKNLRGTYRPTRGWRKYR
ncbi:hypothetical protein ACIQ9K_36600, partial [Streptomyces microflavus]